MSDCPDDGTLLLLGSGELDAGDERRIAAHLETCSDCRARAGEVVGLDRAIREFGMDRPDALAERTERLRARLAADEEREAVRRRRVRLAIGLAAALVVVFVVQSRYTEDLSASAIMARAVAKERDASGHAVRHVRIRFQEPAGASREAFGEMRGGELNVVPAAFGSVGAEINLRRPLSAADYMIWREGSTSGRRDDVTATSEQLTLRTSVPTGHVRVRELRLQATTYRVVGQVWVREDGARLTVDEVWTVDASSGSLAADAPPSSRVSDDAPGVEERVLTAYLAVSNLDPDGQLDVSVKDGLVTVQGTVSTEQERRALTSQVGHDVRNSQVVVAVGATRSTTTGSALNEWAERTLNTKEARDAFFRDMRGAASAIDRHLERLKALGERYPTARESRLSLAERRLLDRLLTGEYRKLIRSVMALDARVTLVSARPLEGARALDERVPADWRARSVSARRPAHDLRQKLDSWFTQAGRTTDTLDVSNATHALWRALEPSAHSAGRPPSR